MALVERNNEFADGSSRFQCRIYLGSWCPEKRKRGVKRSSVENCRHLKFAALLRRCVCCVHIRWTNRCLDRTLDTLVLLVDLHNIILILRYLFIIAHSKSLYPRALRCLFFKLNFPLDNYSWSITETYGFSMRKERPFFLNINFLAIYYAFIKC